MTLYKKSFFKEVNLKRNYNCIISGPDPVQYREQFKKNYLFADLNQNLYSKDLLLKSFFLFFKLIFKFKPNYENLRVILTLSLIIPIIKKKSIKKIICFFDYSKLGKALKKILKKEIVLIGLQHSMRASHMDRENLIKGFDYYFLWDHYKHKNKIKNCKFINFGSLKSYVVLERQKKWNYLRKKFKKNKNLVLISLYGGHNSDFENRFLKNLSKNRMIDKINSVYKDFMSKKITLNFRENLTLEFFLNCLALSKIVKNNNFKLTIINRYTNLMNNGGENSYNSKKEKIFFNNFFEKYKILGSDHHRRLAKALKLKNSIFITNVSSMGKELLALNYKVIFYSFLNYKYNPDYFDKNSIFCLLKRDDQLLLNKIKKISNLSEIKFKKEKYKSKKTFLSFNPDKKKFKYFLTLSGLELKGKMKLN